MLFLRDASVVIAFIIIILLLFSLGVLDGHVFARARALYKKKKEPPPQPPPPFFVEPMMVRVKVVVVVDFCPFCASL